jgi:hypothetical protein
MVDNVLRRRLCRNRKEAVTIVIPAKAGIQNMLKILDSPVSGTGQAQSRASLARNDKKVIATQSPGGGGPLQRDGGGKRSKSLMVFMVDGGKTRYQKSGGR